MCVYCKKVNNTPILESTSVNSGLKVDISVNKNKDRAEISAFGFYDSCVGIESISTRINYCPICGRKLVK